MVTVWFSPIGNGALLPTLRDQRTSGGLGTGADADLRPEREPLAFAMSLASVLSRTSPVVLNVTRSP